MNLSNIFGAGNPVEIGILVALLVYIGLPIFWIWQIVDVCRREFPNGEKTTWLLLVILLPVIGALIYVFTGKKQGQIARV